MFQAKLGREAPRENLTLVIARSASEKAIHLAACGAMDCFAEPVIGRASARPVRSQ